MKRFTKWLIALMLVISSATPYASVVKVTPAKSLIVDGVNVNEGILTLLAATTFNVLAQIQPGDPVFVPLVTSPVINPVVIGSDEPTFLFNAPAAFKSLNLYSFLFQVTNPAPATPASIVSGVAISALTEFNFSLPTTTGLSKAPFDFIDFQGNHTYASGFGLSLTADPAAEKNLDILGNGSLFVTFTAANLEFLNLAGESVPVTFQQSGSIGLSSVPIPAAFWLFGSVLLLWVKRNFNKNLA
ncbi:MAG: hypothetical protein WC782_15790 [Methylococcaceae bacterium]|jgi:hypothetical protein